jgi:hypothetical protein
VLRTQTAVKKLLVARLQRVKNALIVVRDTMYAVPKPERSQKVKVYAVAKVLRTQTAVKR